MNNTIFVLKKLCLKKKESVRKVTLFYVFASPSNICPNKGQLDSHILTSQTLLHLLCCHITGEVAMENSSAIERE